MWWRPAATWRSARAGGPEQSVMTLRETGDGWRLVDVEGVG